MIVFKLFYLQLSLGIQSHNDHLQRTLDPSTLPVITTGENLSLRTIFFLASNSNVSTEEVLPKNPYLYLVVISFYFLPATSKKLIFPH